MIALLRASRVLCAVSLLFAAAIPTALAHITSTGLATLDASTGKPEYRLTLNAREVGPGAADLPTAAAGDTAAASRIAGWAPTLITLAADGKPCRIARVRVQGSQLGDERVALWLDFACPSVPGTLRLDERFWQQFGGHYRTITSIRRADGTREERVFDREQLGAELAAQPAPSRGWIDFARLGVEHILSGADHLLFLAALLLGSRSLRALLITVTAFTLAHSAALALAVLGWVAVSPAIVEPLIAASIVWVALENLLLASAPMVRRYALAFAFGLIHGLAFSEVLRELQLGGWALARGLISFNLGVEAGQALVVVVLAPLLAWTARHAAARRWERAASLVIALAGAGWLVQRLVS